MIQRMLIFLTEISDFLIAVNLVSKKEYSVLRKKDNKSYFKNLQGLKEEETPVRNERQRNSWRIS